MNVCPNDVSKISVGHINTSINIIKKDIQGGYVGENTHFSFFNYVHNS